MSIFTKEVIQKILNDDWLLMDDCEGLENCTVIKELARMALAFIEMRDQIIEIAKCFLVIDDIRKIIRILNDKDWNDTNGFRCIQTDVGKELESVIDGLIDQIKPSLSPRPDEIKKYIRETLIEKGLYDGLRLALSNAGIAAPESDEMLAVKQELYVQELVTLVKDRKPFQSSPVACGEPAPVVPDDVLKALQKVARIRLDMDGFDGDRRGIADCLCDAEEALIEVVNRRAAMLAAARQEVSHG